MNCAWLLLQTEPADEAAEQRISELLDATERRLLQLRPARLRVRIVA